MECRRNKNYIEFTSTQQILNLIPLSGSPFNCSTKKSKVNSYLQEFHKNFPTITNVNSKGNKTQLGKLNGIITEIA